MREARERASVKGQPHLSTADLHALVEDLLVVEAPVDEADLVEQMEALERVKSATCSVGMSTLSFAGAEVAARIDRFWSLQFPR